MEKEYIITGLVNHGYPEKAANQISEHLAQMASDLQRVLYYWIENGNMSDYEVNGYSAKGLMSRFHGMTYPAALLTLDWLTREPDKASKAIERGIR